MTEFDPENWVPSKIPSTFEGPWSPLWEVEVERLKAPYILCNYVLKYCDPEEICGFLGNKSVTWGISILKSLNIIVLALFLATEAQLWLDCRSHNSLHVLFPKCCTSGCFKELVIYYLLWLLNLAKFILQGNINLSQTWEQGNIYKGTR